MFMYNTLNSCKSLINLLAYDLKILVVCECLAQNASLTILCAMLTTNSRYICSSIFRGEIGDEFLALEIVGRLDHAYLYARIFDILYEMIFNFTYLNFDVAISRINTRKSEQL